MGEVEDRQWRRIERKMSVMFRCPSRGQADWRALSAQDISLGGLRFIREQAYALNTAMEVTLQFPGLQEPFVVRGVVVWARVVPTGTIGVGSMTEHGLKFLDLDPAARRVIARFVEGHTDLGA